VAEPTSININTFGTNKVDDGKIIALVQEHFDLRPWGIITMLDLLRPIYQQTAAYGHLGREDIDLPWERTDKVELLKEGSGV
jgi:S-adenosylmethionine synthetase